MLPFATNTPAVEEELLQRDNELDDMTVQILQCLFEAMLHLLNRQASEHLHGGRYYTAGAEVWEETRSALKHNKLPEFFFGQLDFLMKYRPNASVLCNEAFLMFSHNKTGAWMASLGEEERAAMLRDARKDGRQIRKKFQARNKEIGKLRLEKLQAKAKELKDRKVRQFKKKEKLTSDIMYFGLWQADNDINEHFAEIPSKTEKIKAVKAQITFRNKVLHQVVNNKNIFAFSAGKKKKILEELKENLETLINEARHGASEEIEHSKKPLLMGKHIKHRFDDRWYMGRVLSVVPSFIKCYNVKYDNDPAIYVYQLQQDYAAGDLVIVPQ